MCKTQERFGLRLAKVLVSLSDEKYLKAKTDIIDKLKRQENGDQTAENAKKFFKELEYLMAIA